jgi:hypothetical protein
VSATGVLVAVVISTMVIVVTIDIFMSTSDSTFAVILSTCVVVIAVNVSVVDSSVVVAVDFSTVIFVCFIYRSVDAPNFAVAAVISASIVIVTGDLVVNTSYFFITIRFVTFVSIDTSVRSISYNASLL